MKISGLTVEQAQAVDEAIALAADYLAIDPPFSPVEVQRLYDAVARDHSERVEAQIAVGMAFGEMIISKADYEWVRVSDEWRGNSFVPSSCRGDLLSDQHAAEADFKARRGRSARAS